MDTHHNSSISVPQPLPASSLATSAGSGTGVGHTSTVAGSTSANPTGSTTPNATNGTIPTTNPNINTNTNIDHIDSNVQTSSNFSSGSVIQSYPFTDTLAIVSILFLLPNWLSVLLLLLYVSLGTPKFVLKFLDLSFYYLTNSSRSNNNNTNNNNTNKNVSSTDDSNDLDHDEMDTSMTMEDQITSNDEITVSFSGLLSTICWLLLDCLIVFIILLASPNILPYINLLSMSFVSSNIASTKNRTILNAILSALTIILIDFLFKYLINYYDFLDISSNSSSSSNANSNSIFTKSYFDYSNSLLNYQRRPLSLLSYRISLSSPNSIDSVNSYSDLLSSSSSSSSSSAYFILSSIFRIIFQMDYLIEFLHSTLSIYTIMHNLNPFLQKSIIISSLTKHLDNLTKKANNTKKLFTKNNNNNNTNNLLENINNSNNNINISANTNTDLTNNNTSNNTTNNTNTTSIDSQYNDSQLKNNINNNSHINDSNQQDMYDEFDEFDDIDSKYNNHTTNIINPISSTTTNNLNSFSNFSSTANKYSKRKDDLQKIRIPTDIAHSVLPLTTYQHSLKLLKNSKNSNDGNGNNNNSGKCSTEDDDNVPASFPTNHHEIHMNDISTSSVVVSYNFENYCKIAIFPSSTDFYSKRHFNPILEKKIKSLSNKSQQPIWSFFTAIKAMFTRQDLYSGEYYQHNALVTTRNSPSSLNSSSSSSPFASSPYKIREGDITRSLVNEAQCFIWITSETYVAVELLGTTINRILVKVNGVVWHQISSGRMNEREIVIVGGLSPLSQYDIEFINVNTENELELLAITTISTIHKDMTLTQSKPSSPLLTLQESLVTTNEAIVRERGKLKKLKNDWRKRSSTLKTEIDLLNKRTTIGDESRNYKKVSSLRQAVSKSEEENSKIELDLQELYNKETEFDEKYLDEKRKYEKELRILTSFENEYNKKMDEFLNKIKSIENDKNQLLLKKEKLINKKSKILNDIERIKKEINELRSNEIKFRENNREIRSNTRTQKFKVLSTDINRIEKELTNEYKKMLNDNSN
ncbi:hypothetical protein BVG19_g2479 [[Candida] boidinii]|nr:hypothetical protein BVG19_g2479 [[Candida] boidinii]OWB53737.1 hypothetical protein B5S27_g5345 [[Candida] boidinii]OWB83805.1 hypothetical protein B5S33_g2439 [[Candida] boidinii]